LIEYINTIYVEFLSFSKDNPVFSGVIGIWGLGVVTFLLRTVPYRVFSFFKRQCTTTLVLNSHDQIYFDFIRWTSENNLHSFVRNLNFTNNSRWGCGSAMISVGYGTSFFVFNKRLFFMTRQQESANQTEKIKETIRINMFGRNHTLMEKLCVEVVKYNKKDDETNVYCWHQDMWQLMSQHTKRNFDTISLPKGTKTKIKKHIKDFKDKKSWYTQNGIPYRTGILLYGPPGTGKTSLIKAISSFLDKSLYVLNLNSMSDKTLTAALSFVPKGGIIAIEDIDACGLKNRKTKVETSETELLFNDLTLSGVLNAIDGISSSDDRILISTTNYIERLDDALIRPGRFDLKIKIDFMTKEILTEYLLRFFPGPIDLTSVNLIKNISPSTVQQLVFENLDNLDNLIHKLTKEENE
jgi:mitochondrial chaperone BCS1